MFKFNSKNIKYFSFLFLFVIISACKPDNEKNTQYNPVEIIRYDKLIFELDTSDIKSGFDSIKTKYPDFTKIYFEKILNFPDYNQNEETFLGELKLFVTDSAMQKLYSYVNEEFGDMNDLKSEFGKALFNQKKYFPKSSSPTFYSYISGFAVQRFIFEDNNHDGLAFGLDLFLGEKFPYERLEKGKNTFSKYLVRTYNKDHLVKKVMELWVEDMLGNNTGDRAIDYMIKNGKKLYIIKQLIPDIQDSVLLEYSGEQMTWLENNEQEMWTHFIKNDFFYTNDNYKIKRLISPGPNSQALGMPKNSPGQTGSYLGYRIVNTFMKRYKENNLQNLIDNSDSQKILELSKFKPKRNN